MALSHDTRTRLALCVTMASLCLTGSAPASSQIAATDDWELALMTAARGSTVNLEAGLYQGRCNLFLLKDLTIIGLGGAARTVIDCQSSGRHFYVGNFSVVTIQGVSLQNGNAGAEGGGCILVDAGSTVTVLASSMQHCSAIGLGGAVFAIASSLSFDDVHFRGNSAWGGGAVAIINGTGLMSSTTINDCLAYEDGGAVQIINSTLTMVASNATSNTAFRNGGAIHAVLLSTVIASGSSFTRNRAGTFTGTSTVYFSFPGLTINRGNGGAVHVEFSSVLLASQGTRCLENEAEWAGGCISAFQECGVQLWDDVQVSGNTAGATLEGGRGGGISVLLSGLAAWQGVRISDNTVGPPFVYGPDWLGGGVLSQAAVVALSYGVSVTNNYATVGGGLLGVGFVQVELHDDVEVVGNTAFVMGGGLLFWIDSVALLRNKVRVSQNTLVVGDGAGINVRDSNLTLGDGIEVHGNVGAGQTGGTWEPKGAGIMLEATTLRVEGAVSVANNSIDNGFGAGLSTSQRGCDIIVEGELLVEGNLAAVSGGGFRLGLGSRLVNRGALRVRGNRAGSRGGGLFAVGSELELGNAEVSGNAARGDGGGMALINDARTECGGCVLAANTAASGGGAAVDSSPLRLRGAQIAGNRAGSGGGVVAVGAAEVSMQASSVTSNAAEVEGGGVASYEEAVLRVQGGVRFEGNSAGERGGGMLVSGASGRIDGEGGGVVVARNHAQLQGGGLCYTTHVEVAGGTVEITGNSAGSEGGGVCGVGWRAELALAAAARVRITANNATDGGGVGLMALARLRVVPEECPSSCLPQRNNSVCNMECMSAGCDWDGGDCNERWVRAGEEAVKPCDRFRCPLLLQEDPGKCPVDCLWASCDYAEGNPNCQPYFDSMARCPLWDAVSLRSLEQDPGLIYVKAGGTARGWGRCVAGGCNASAPPPVPDWCTGEECEVGGEVGEGWCRVVDDDSRVLQYSFSSDVYDDVGEAWGVCSDRLRLPLSGFQYDAASLAALPDMSMEQLLRGTPGCGAAPLTVQGNRAARQGGGLFKSSCNLMLHRQDECFLEGLRGSMAVSFIDNAAQAAGGAVFVACHQLGSCSAKSGLPLGGDREALSFRGNTAGTYGADVATGPQTLRVESAVTAYRPGQDTLDLELIITDGEGQVMRSEEGAALPLLVSVGACGLGARKCSSTEMLQPEGFFTLRGGADRVSAKQFEMQLRYCEEGSEGLSLLVAVRGADIASLDTLQLEVPVTCLPCQQGHSRQRSVLRDGRAVWTCTTCDVDSYVLDSNSVDFQCQQCPKDLQAHGFCGGGEAVRFGHAQVALSFSESTRDSLSTVEFLANVTSTLAAAAHHPLHVAPLQICDVHHAQCRELAAEARAAPQHAAGAHETMHGARATEATQEDLSTDSAQHGALQSLGAVLRLKVESSAQSSSALLAALSLPSLASSVMRDVQRMGHSVEGFRLEALPASDVVGEYVVQGQRLVLTDCAPGYILVNASYERQSCVRCGATASGYTYALWPLEGCHSWPPVCEERSCVSCPVGADCLGGDSFVPHVSDSTWGEEERTMVHGSLVHVHREKRVQRCGQGYVLVRSEEYPELDSCVRCPADTYSRVDAVLHGSMHVQSGDKVSRACIKCPHNAECPGGASVIPKKGYWLPGPEPGRRAAAHVTEDEGEVELFQCPVDACEDEGRCAEGRTGPVCAVCVEGFAMSGTECISCEEFDLHTARVTALVIALVLLAVVWYYAAWRPYFVGDDPENIRRAESGPAEAPEGASCLTSFRVRVYQLWNRMLFHLLQSHYLAYIKVFISFWQVASTFRTNFHVEWPKHLATIWRWTSVLRFDFLNLPAPSCMLAEYDYLTLLQGYTLAPIVLAALFAVPTGLMVAKKAQNSETYRRVQNTFTFSIAFMAFLLYPMLSLVTTSTFKCQEVAGEWHLYEDFQVRCPWKEPRSLLFIWGVASTLLFPLGIPFLAWWMLWTWRVPAMAREKQDRAVLERMVWLHKLHADEALTAQIASYMGGLDAVTEQDNVAVIRQRAQQFYDGATLGGKHALTPKRMLEYCHKLGLIGNEDEVAALFDIFHDDTMASASLSFDEFVDFILVVEEQERRVVHFTSTDAIPDAQLEDMCNYDWNLLCREDDEVEGSGVEREMKRRLKKRFRMQSAHRASENVASKYTRAVRKRSSEVGSFTGTLPADAAAAGARPAAGAPAAVKADERGEGDVAPLASFSKDVRQAAQSAREEEGEEEGGVPSSTPARAGACGRQRHASEGSVNFVSLLNKVSSARAAQRTSLLLRRASSGGHHYDEFHVRRVVPLCPLGPEAVRDDRIAWLERTGRKLRRNGYLETEPLRWTEHAEEEREALQKIAFLFDAYKVEHWYYELVEMFRKFIMTGVMGLMFDSSQDQLSAAFVVTSIALLHFVRVQPYTSMMLNHLQTASLTVQAATLLYGLLISYQSLQEQLTGEAADAPVADAIILALHILIFALPPLAVFHEEGRSVTTLIKKSFCAPCRKTRRAAQLGASMDSSESMHELPSVIYRSMDGPVTTFSLAQGSSSQQLRSTGASKEQGERKGSREGVTAHMGFVSSSYSAELAQQSAAKLVESSVLMGATPLASGRYPSVVPDEEGDETRAELPAGEGARAPASNSDSDSREGGTKQAPGSDSWHTSSPEPAFVVAPSASVKEPPSESVQLPHLWQAEHGAPVSESKYQAWC